MSEATPIWADTSDLQSEADSQSAPVNLLGKEGRSELGEEDW